MNNLLKKATLAVLVIGVLGAGAWAGRKAYRKASESRLVSEARGYLQSRDAKNASLCLQRALQINPFSLEATRLTADMLEAGGSPAAVTWRMRAAMLVTNDMSLRLAWAETALKQRDTAAASTALGGLDPATRATPAFHKIAGTLAWALGLAAEAEEQFTLAQAAEPASESIAVNLATIRLGSTNAAAANAARATLERIPAQSPLRRTALRYLVADAESHGALARCEAYTRELVADPAAPYVDRLARIQVLHRSRGPEYAAYRAALEKEARESADHAAALGKWMLAADGATNALRWLTALPAAVRTNLPVPLVVADAQVAAKDWTGLLATTSRQDWSEANFFRSALESLALRSTDQAGAARAAWQRALRLAATRPEQLMRLSKISADWGWSVERLEVLQELVSRFPKQTWAVDELIASFYGSGNSRALGDLLGKLHAAHPDDARLKNNLAAIWLLRKSNLAEAHKLAREAFETAPDNPFFASTFAYSLLVQGKPSEAVHAFDKVNPDHYAKIPAIAAYYGVVHAQAGLRDVARAPLQLAAKARLLPEEQELVRLAAARL